MNELLKVGRTWSITQAQHTLQVSRRTVYYWIAAGKLMTIRTLSGGSQRILTDSIWVTRRLRELEEHAKLETALANINRRPQEP